MEWHELKIQERTIFKPEEGKMKKYMERNIDMHTSKPQETQIKTRMWN